MGCGPKYLPGFFHVDAKCFDHVDHVGPVDDLSYIVDESVELIYASHVLEHFGRNEYRRVLCEWYRVLRMGGRLRLGVPDFRASCEVYLSDQSLGGKIDLILGLCVGGQRDEFDFHKMIFDEESLSSALLEAGFEAAYRWDWRATGHSEIDDYSQSYLPHMDKHNGRLMSLNIEARK